MSETEKEAVGTSRDTRNLVRLIISLGNEGWPYKDNRAEVASIVLDLIEKDKMLEVKEAAKFHEEISVTLEKATEEGLFAWKMFIGSNLAWIMGTLLFQ